MRVLLTTHQFFPNYIAGTEVAALSTGVELRARGHEVHVLTVDPDVRKESAEVGYKDYDFRGLKVHALELPRPGRLLPLEIVRNEYDNPLVAEHVRRYVGRIEPDAVHMFHAARLSGSVIGVFRELGVPLVFTSTDFWSVCVRHTLAKPSGELSEGPDEISSNCLECRQVEKLLPPAELPEATQDKRAFYREIAERALAGREGEHPSMARVRAMLYRTEFLRERINSVDAILAPTDIMRRMLVANGIKPDLVRVSPYGMDLSRFRDFERPTPVPGRLRIGFMGQVNRSKGLHVLIEAFKKLPEDGGATLRISGDLRRHSADYARELYEQAGGDPRINFAGPFPNERVANELAKMDVLVVPSTWYENTPLVIFEAFASGMPVIATNLGGMSEVVHHGENGFLFESGDAEGLAQQLRRLMDEPGLVEELGRNAGNVRTVQDSVDEALGLYEGPRARKNGVAGETGPNRTPAGAEREVADA